MTSSFHRAKVQTNQKGDKMKVGKLTISQVHTNINQIDYIKLQVVDKKHKHIINIEIDFKEFAQTLTGMGHVDCEYKLFD